MKMKNYFHSFFFKLAALLLFILFSFQVSDAQNATAASTQNAKDSQSKKEIKTNNNGKIVMRVALKGTNDNTAVTGTSTNLLIYNTATAGASPYHVYPGYYTNVGTTEQPKWKRVDITVQEAVKNNP